MTVRSEELQNGRVAAKPAPGASAGGGWLSLLFGRLAVWLIICAFGPIWWLINGGYSVIGFPGLAASFGPYGSLAAQLIMTWTFNVDMAKRVGLSVAQPYLPWGLVIAGSILQIVFVYRKLKGLSTPAWLIVFGFLLSAYDLGTTWYGLGTVSWIRTWSQFLLTPILTFGLEVGIGFALKAPKR